MSLARAALLGCFALAAPVETAAGATTAATAPWPTDGWARALPADLGMDGAKLRAARDYALSAGGSGMVTRGGRLVISWGDRARTYDLKSTTKSIGGTALGLALLDGLVGLGDPARRHLAGFAVPPAANAETGWRDKVTLLNLATHTAGFEKVGGFGRLLFEPGTAWAYSDGGPNWLADVLTSVFRRDLLDVLTERVFSALGLRGSDIRWRRNAYRPQRIDGVIRRELGSGIDASVDAMARIGYLYLREGTWDGRRILPRSFVRMVAKPVPAFDGLPVVNAPDVLDGSSTRYGVLWWSNANGAMAGVPRDAFWAWGLYDSLIVVIPSLDIVASRAGDGWSCCWGDMGAITPFIEPIARSVAGAR